MSKFFKALEQPGDLDNTPLVRARPWRHNGVSS